MIPTQDETFGARGAPGKPRASPGRARPGAGPDAVGAPERGRGRSSTSDTVGVTARARTSHLKERAGPGGLPPDYLRFLTTKLQLLVAALPAASVASTLTRCLPALSFSLR